jgi:hypothetical protein
MKRGYPKKESVMHLLRDVREAAMTRRLTPFEKASNDERQ